MSEIAKLKTAVADIKKDFLEYVSYGSHQWSNQERRVTIKNNLSSNLLLALKLLKSNYPEEVFRQFESKTQDFSKWVDHAEFLSKPDDPLLPGSIINMIRNFLAFFEALFK